MNHNSKNFYNKFHQQSSVQYKLISENNFTYKTILKIFIKHIKPNDTVLDIGCGVGTLSLFFGNKCRKVYGIDISDKAISIAIKSAKQLNLDKKLKFKVLDFPNKCLSKKFNKIIFSETLEHIQDEDKALNSIFKMLKNGGKLILTVPSQNSFIYKIGLAKNFDLKVGHLRRYTVFSLKKLLLKNGFKIVKIYKREGVIRNVLFFIKSFNFLIKFMKGNIGSFVNWLDFQTMKIFGESQIIVIATKK